jgi:hypothetical protein
MKAVESTGRGSTGAGRTTRAEAGAGGGGGGGGGATSRGALKKAFTAAPGSGMASYNSVGTITTTTMRRA